MVPIKYTDKGCLETVGPNGAQNVTTLTARMVALVHNGLLMHSFLIMVLGLVTVIWATMVANLWVTFSFTDERVWVILVVLSWVFST